MSVKDCESHLAKMYGANPMWYHLDCFRDNRDEIGFTADQEPTK